MEQKANSPQAYSADELEALTREGHWLTPYRLPDGRLTRPAGGQGSPKDRRKTRLVQTFDVQGKTVLDIGCSEGVYSFYLAEQGATVLGLDLDETRIRKADFIRRALGFQQVRFETGDILDPAFRKTLQPVDWILAWGFLHRIPDPFTALSRMGSLCECLSLEWRMPAMLFPPGFSGATHGRPAGKARPAAAAAGDWTPETAVSDAPEYWRLNIGAVNAMLRPGGFRRFTASTIRNESSWRQVAGHWAAFLVHLALRRDAPLQWGPSRRIHLLAEKNPAGAPNRLSESGSFRPAVWDGRFGG